jgi:hypothetical protein
MSISDILINLGLSVLSIFIALLYENLGDPRLKISIKSPKKVKIGDNETIYLNLFVFNQPRKRWPFVSRQTAYSCHGDVTFFDRKGITKLCGPMPIRWSGNPEPLKYEIVNNKVIPMIEPSLIKSSRYVDIPRDEKEEMDIAVRFYGEMDAYGWNSESYLHLSRNPEFKLTPGIYVIEVNLTCSGSSTKDKLLLINPEKIEEFRIEDYKDRSDIWVEMYTNRN